MGVAMLVAACGQSAQPTPSASTAASTAPTAAPVTRGQGGDLKILYWQAPTILNGHQATGTKDYDAARLILEPLASHGNDGLGLANGLASEAPTPQNGGVSADLTTVTWKLRQNVKWSDGTPFSADDVAFTFTYQCDAKAGSSTFAACKGVKSVVAKDANTAVVTYDAPTAFYYQWGVGGFGMILQKKQFADCLGEKAKNCPANLAPIGTGPYKLKEFKPGDVALYEMNTNFRDANKPYFKTVTLKGGGDATSAARAVFQTGEYDYAWNLQIEASVLKPMAQASDKAVLLQNYGAAVERMLMNYSDPTASLGDRRAEPDTKHPFLTDKAVRRALAMATDRNSVGVQIYGDGLVGKASCNILAAPEPMASKNTDAMDVCKFDLAKAEAELQNAGWVKGSDGIRAKGGVRLEITFQTTVNAVRQKTQDIMKQNWEKIGFKVTLKSVDAGVFFTNTSPDGANKFFADVEMYTNSHDPDPTTYLSGWTCDQRNGKAANWNNGGYERYCNADYDKIIADFRKETDPAKRAALAIKANDHLVSEAVVIPVVNRVAPTLDAASKTLKGVKISVWDSVMYNIADWSK